MDAFIRLVSKSVFGLIFLLLNGAVHAQTPPNNTGPVRLIAASRFGGTGDDTLIGAAILRDGTIVLAGNAPVWPVDGVSPKVIGAPVGTGGGFLLHLDADGQNILGETRLPGVTLEKMKSGPEDEIFLLGDPHARTGRFIARLAPNLQGFQFYMFGPDPQDFGVDGNGDIIVLAGHSLIRYGAAGTKKWTATWQAHGQDRPGAVAVSPQTGLSVVLGYGMTGTGHEPYKDPYAFAFDRAGRPAWTLWNPDPSREASADHGGNGLMADTTGHAAGVTAEGRLLLLLFADGGNTVGGRDPSDPDKPLPPAVTAGVYQPEPGYGFQGAGKTSVLVRVNPDGGAVEKETWMCAWKGWPVRDHANSLRLDSADGDAQGHVFAVGDSASACPVLLPWYTVADGGYKGGSFLAVFDQNLGMMQCGTFSGVNFSAVCCRGRRVVAVGTADGKAAVPLHRPLPSQPGSGDQDGYFAIFQTGDTLP